jgi:hypothetical protein
MIEYISIKITHNIIKWQQIENLNIEIAYPKFEVNMKVINKLTNDIIYECKLEIQFEVFGNDGDIIDEEYKLTIIKNTDEDTYKLINKKLQNKKYESLFEDGLVDWDDIRDRLLDESSIKNNKYKIKINHDVPTLDQYKGVQQSQPTFTINMEVYDKSTLIYLTKLEIECKYCCYGSVNIDYIKHTLNIIKNTNKDIFEKIIEQLVDDNIEKLFENTIVKNMNICEKLVDIDKSESE